MTWKGLKEETTLPSKEVLVGHHRPAHYLKVHYLKAHTIMVRYRKAHIIMVRYRKEHYIKQTVSTLKAYNIRVLYHARHPHAFCATCAIVCQFTMLTSEVVSKRVSSSNPHPWSVGMTAPTRLHPHDCTHMTAAT
jgi:hypothetical protein